MTFAEKLRVIKENGLEVSHVLIGKKEILDVVQISTSDNQDNIIRKDGYHATYSGVQCVTGDFDYGYNIVLE